MSHGRADRSQARRPITIAGESRGPLPTTRLGDVLGSHAEHANHAAAAADAMSRAILLQGQGGASPPTARTHARTVSGVTRDPRAIKS